jgi:hypothetical protein
MNIEEENKAEEFYLNSDIEGTHCTRTNTVVLNYLDLKKLMHNYAQIQGQTLPIDSVVGQSEQLIAFAEWKEYNGKWETHEQQVKNFLKEYKSN